MPTEAKNFKISEAPMAPPVFQRDSEDTAALPSHYGTPLLLAIARNPQTLFLCWSVDWHAAFGSNVPADRKGHVKVKGNHSERVESVEPLSGFCSISNLQPGDAYEVELGFYAPASQWHIIASEEITMPLHGRVSDVEASLDVAAIPFHLGFQRLTELFGGHVGLAHSLAAFEKGMADESAPTQEDEKLLRALELSPEDLNFIAALRQRLEKVKTQPGTPPMFFGSSPPSGGGS